jgi:hypothetical protein
MARQITFQEMAEVALEAAIARGTRRVAIVVSGNDRESPRVLRQVAERAPGFNEFLLKGKRSEVAGAQDVIGSERLDFQDHPTQGGRGLFEAVRAPKTDELDLGQGTPPSERPPPQLPAVDLDVGIAEMNDSQGALIL